MNKMKDYAVTVVGKAKEEISSHCRLIAGTAATTAMMVVPTVCAFAEDGASSSGTSLLTGDTLTAITGGFTDLAATAGVVVGLAVTASVSIIAISAGAKYALKKMKGALSQAA